MHDPVYKQLFSRPRMVRDLLDGFAARSWSGALDFDTLAPLPASYVGRDLQQRHGDLAWRIRFRGDRWLYVVLLLEFQSRVDPSMAVRMLTYTALLYQRLTAEGALRDHQALPPVLPVVLYNGRGSWTAPVDVGELIASGGGAVAPYQPSQRYFLLDAARTSDAELPAGNLVSALVGLEKGRDTARLRAPLKALIDLLQRQEDEELTRVFAAWLTQVLRLPERLPAQEVEPLARLKETYTMLEETVREWMEQGRARGLAQGLGDQRALLCRLAARKFGASAAERLAAALSGVGDPARLAEVGDWIIECATAADLLARVAGAGRPGD